MRWLGIVVAVGLSLSGCGGPSDPFSGGCLAKVRYDGRRYVEVGFSSRDVSTAGTATIVACAADPDVTEVDAFAFPDYNRIAVVAVQMDGDVYRVLVEESQSETFIMNLHEDGLLNAGEG